MQSQLAEITAQLRALKLQQKQLEARNVLLEHMARINQGPLPSSQSARNSIDSDLGQVRNRALASHSILNSLWNPVNNGAEHVSPLCVTHVTGNVAFPLPVSR